MNGTTHAGVQDTGASRGRAGWDRLALGLLALVAAVRVALWAGPIGFLGGDDVEMLAAGFRAAAGLEYEPWPIRSLLWPYLLVAPAVWLGAHLGLTAPASLVRVAELPFLLLSILNVVLVFRLAWRFSEGEHRRLMALLAAGLYALHWLPLTYAVTTYPRTGATTCVLGAALLVLRPRARVTTDLAAGALLALAFAARFSEAVFLLPLLLLHPPEDEHGLLRWRRAATVVAGFALGAVVAVGLFDWLTWGRPFSSLVEFARYTLLERRSSSLAAEQGALFYLARAGFWAVPPLLPFLFVRLSRPQRQLWLPIVLPVVMLSLIHHKEMRYLQAVIPFYAVLLSIGASRWLAHGRRRRLVATVLLVLGLGFCVRSAVRIHQRSSRSAVAVARQLAAEPAVDRVVLRQAWAYGLRLFLGNGVEVRDFDSPPGPEQLHRALDGVDAVALYAEDLERQPALATVLSDAGLQEVRRVRRGASRTVVLFRSDP